MSITRLQDGVFLDVNESKLSLLGYEREELLGRSPVGIGIVDAEQDANAAQALGERGAIRDREFRVRTKAGETRIVLTSAEIIDLGGEECLLSEELDITERKRAEEELRRSQAQYRGLLSTIDGIVWEADARTLQFTFVSPKAEHILGHPLDRWLNEPAFWQDHIHPLDREAVLEFCRKTASERTDRALTYRMRAADDRIVWLHTVVSVAQEEGGEAQLRGVMVDITKQKELEGQFRQAQRWTPWANWRAASPTTSTTC
jgi:PAS domain S-box-containing protein